jgi:hypothetical protein
MICLRDFAPSGRFGLAQRQAVAVGGHAPQAGLAQVEQQAVEIEPDILLCHRERRAFDQLLEAGFRDLDAFDQVHVVGRREFLRRQRRQREAAAPGTDRDAIAVQREADLAAVRQGAHDLEQFAGRNRGFAGFGVLERGARDHFHFEVRAGQRQTLVLDRHQQVGQHRQGLPTLDHIDHLLQRLEQHFTLNTETHTSSCFDVLNGNL